MHLPDFLSRVLPGLLATVLAVPVAWAGPDFIPAGLGSDAGILEASGSCIVAPYTPGPSLAFWGASDRLESVYQLVRLSDCPNCINGVLLLNSITFRSRTGGDPSCTYPVEVTVVGVVDGACPAPDVNRVLCGPFNVDVTVTSSLSNIVVPLPANCCVSEDVYVRIRWLTNETCGSGGLQPAHQVGAETCVPCAQYFRTLSAFPALTDVCAVYSTGIYLSVDVDCCDPTPVLPDSWGRLKQIYR